jgi:PleD family two-component response regulator
MGVYENIRTLVVDQSGHSKTLLRSLLTNLGAFGVEAVSGTDEALAILRTDAFSIVFCDELAGPLDPFAFLRALRTDLATRDVTVPVVLISAGADISKIKAARDCGINDVIVKPVSIGTIDRKLKSLLYPAVPSSALKPGP